MPCVCIFNYTIILSSIEFFTFIISVAIFYFLSLKKKKKIDTVTKTLIILFLTAFLFHYGFVIYAYTGPSGCRKIYSGTSYICFIPQAIFFLIFIWVIFKLLVVWRVMVANTKSQQQSERKRLKIIQFIYLSMWLFLWIS